jgi:hypothetical protein
MADRGRPRSVPLSILLLALRGAAQSGSGDVGSGSGYLEPESGSGDASGETPPPPPYRSPAPPSVPFDELVSPSLVDYLRAGDRRMVRPSPSTITGRRREEPHVRSRIVAVLGELKDRATTHGVDVSLPPLARAKAAEAVTLLVTDHPSNRALIGSTPGVLAALVELVDRAWRDAVAHDANVATLQTDHMFEAAEAAAEAIWILAFNSPPNHAALLELGAVETLGALVTARDVHGVATPARAAMWAAAALQNLAASYCATPDGRCTWWWDGPRLVPRGGRASLTVDAEAARQRITAAPQLVAALVRYACEGPVGAHDPGHDHDESASPWPSKAVVESRTAPSVVPWAAAGALKNLALSDVGAAAVLRRADAAACLCALAWSSRDWLESSKARAALEHLQPRAAGGGFACEEETKPRRDYERQLRDEL